MKVEVVKKPSKLSKSNPNWLQISEELNALKPDECLKITGLTNKEIGSLRQQAYREAKARTFTRTEANEPVVYLYKR